MEYQTEPYETPEGISPYDDWMDHLAKRDPKTAGRLQKRADRLKYGNFGKWRSVAPGIRELIEDFGPGYRIYITQVGKTFILLLLGGDKKTQQDDIKKAIQYRADYLMRNQR